MKTFLFVLLAWRHTPIYEALLAQDDIYLPHSDRPIDPGDNEHLSSMDVEVAR